MKLTITNQSLKAYTSRDFCTSLIWLVKTQIAIIKRAGFYHIVDYNKKKLKQRGQIGREVKFSQYEISVKS